MFLNVIEITRSVLMTFNAKVIGIAQWLVCQSLATVFPRSAPICS